VYPPVPKSPPNHNHDSIPYPRANIYDNDLLILEAGAPPVPGAVSLSIFLRLSHGGHKGPHTFVTNLNLKLEQVKRDIIGEDHPNTFSQVEKEDGSQDGGFPTLSGEFSLLRLRCIQKGTSVRVSVRLSNRKCLTLNPDPEGGTDEEATSLGRILKPDSHTLKQLQIKEGARLSLEVTCNMTRIDSSMLLICLDPLLKESILTM